MNANATSPARRRLPLWRLPLLFLFGVIGEEIESRRIGGMMNAWGIDFWKEDLRKAAHRYAEDNWFTKTTERWSDQYDPPRLLDLDA